MIAEGNSSFLSGIVHKIQREIRTTISEVIVRRKRDKQNRNWFYFNFSFESSGFVFNNFKTEKLIISLPLKDETDQFVICLVLPERLSVKIAFYPRTVKRIVTVLMHAEFPFPLFFSSSVSFKL